MRQFFVHFLLILSVWTLLIKFVFPIAYGIAQEVVWSTYIMWDFWWVAHLWLAWAFHCQSRHLLTINIQTNRAIPIEQNLLIFQYLENYNIYL